MKCVVFSASATSESEENPFCPLSCSPNECDLVKTTTAPLRRGAVRAQSCLRQSTFPLGPHRHLRNAQSGQDDAQIPSCPTDRRPGAAARSASTWLASGHGRTIPNVFLVALPTRLNKSLRLPFCHVELLIGPNLPGMWSVWGRGTRSTCPTWEASGRAAWWGGKRRQCLLDR